jgi:hypothetical protein
MCNLYSITTNQAAIIALFRVINRYVGNLPPMPGVFPDYPAPVVSNVGAERELTMMRWGMPLASSSAEIASSTSGLSLAMLRALAATERTFVSGNQKIAMACGSILTEMAALSTSVVDADRAGAGCDQIVDRGFRCTAISPGAHGRSRHPSPSWASGIAGTCAIVESQPVERQD